MSSTIKAFERHIPPQSKAPSPGLGLQSRATGLVAEWQHGPETLSGYALRKLRLALIPSQSVITPTPVGAG